MSQEVYRNGGKRLHLLVWGSGILYTPECYTGAELATHYVWQARRIFGHSDMNILLLCHDAPMCLRPTKIIMWFIRSWRLFAIIQFNDDDFCNKKETRMHSSPLQWPSCGGEVCLRRWVSAWGVCAHPPVDRILDTGLWKHYISLTTVADGNKTTNTNWSEELRTYSLQPSISSRILSLESLLKLLVEYFPKLAKGRWFLRSAFTFS